MDYILPDFRALFSETKSLLREYAWPLTKAIVPGIVIPATLIGVTLCQWANLSKLSMGMLLVLECLLFVGLFIVFIPRSIAVALAATFEQDIELRDLPIWRFLGVEMLIALPALLFQQMLNIEGLRAGLRTLSIPLNFAMAYAAIRLVLAGTVLVWENGSIWFSIRRSWYILRGQMLRFVLYRLVIILPAFILGVFLIVALVFVFLGTVHPLDRAALVANIPVILGAGFFGILPVYVASFYFLTVFDAVVYHQLYDQEEMDGADQEVQAVSS